MRSRRFDLESKFGAIVAETGTVRAHAGGLEIRVLDPDIFPWYKIFMMLINIPHEIWVKKNNKAVIIRTKPPST